MVHPDFSPKGAGSSSLPEGVELPYAYVLYHGPTDPQALREVMKVWSWTVAPLGDSTPLVFLGLEASAQAFLDDFFERHNLDVAVRFLPPVSPEGLAHIYRECAAVLHLGSLSPWTGPVRHALACGRPVVAPESALADALVGPAAYLVPGEDSRAMGAALLTVIVNQEVAKRFSQAARQRAAPWGTSAFGEALVDAYRSLQSGG
jgi:glycosyltransferase involved in cell wall biosynthesis